MCILWWSNTQLSSTYWYAPASKEIEFARSSWGFGSKFSRWFSWLSEEPGTVPPDIHLTEWLGTQITATTGPQQLHGCSFQVIFLAFSPWKWKFYGPKNSCLSAKFFKVDQPCLHQGWSTLKNLADKQTGGDDHRPRWWAGFSPIGREEMWINAPEMTKMSSYAWSFLPQINLLMRLEEPQT